MEHNATHVHLWLTEKLCEKSKGQKNVDQSLYMEAENHIKLAWHLVLYAYVENDKDMQGSYKHVNQP
jgi:DNA-binding transcriptional regulator PaaX